MIAPDLDHLHADFRLYYYAFFVKITTIDPIFYYFLNSAMAEGYLIIYMHIRLGGCYSGLWYVDPMIVIL